MIKLICAMVPAGKRKIPLIITTFFSALLTFLFQSPAIAQALDQHTLRTLSEKIQIIGIRVRQQGPFLPSAAEASLYSESSLCMALAVRLDLQEYTIQIINDFTSSIDSAFNDERTGAHMGLWGEAYHVLVWWEQFAFAMDRVSSADLNQAAAEWDLNCAGREFFLTLPPYGSVTIDRNARVLSGLRESFAVADPSRLSIRILGEVTDGYSSRISDAIAQFPGATTISLGSAGGNVLEAIEAARIIRARGLSTELFDTCESACILVFLGGVERTVWSPPPDMGFHMLSIPGFDVLEVDHVLYDEISEFVYDMGADGSVYVELMGSAAPPEFFYPEVEALCEANIVTWAQRRCSGQNILVRD